MNKAEFDALPKPIAVSEDNARYLNVCAKSSRDTAGRMYASGSGADLADAPLRDLQADAFALLACGVTVEAIVELLEPKWRAYATEQQARVAAAPKIKRGPYSGQSNISHRWVSTEAFENFIPHLIQMADKYQR